MADEMTAAYRPLAGPDRAVDPYRKVSVGEAMMTTTGSERPIFFMKRSDRLIARLKHLLYGIRFAKQVDGQMIMVWTPLPAWFQQFDSRDYHINLIFDIRGHYASGGGRNLIFFDSVTPFPSDVVSLQGAQFDAMRPSGFDRAHFSQSGRVFYSGIYYGFQFEDEKKSQAALDDEVRDIYRSIPLDPVVSRILATAKTKMDAAEYAVLHVRKGDVGEMLKRDLPRLAVGDLDQKALRLTLSHYVSRTAPFDFYYPEIEKCIQRGQKIVFTSDSPETIGHFAKKFGPKHFIDINKFVRARFPIQKAFLDFNMIIGGSRVISTGSTYAAFAAKLGGAELVSVAMSGRLDRLVDFLFEEYVPQLSDDVALRKLLSVEVEQAVREKAPRQEAARALAA
jgi:hypothetical protein